METTLHRQLKDHYAGPNAQIEVKVGRYRIDIVNDKLLIEVQHSGLSSIRDKTRDLLKEHDVEVIKPLIARRRLIKLESEDGPELSRRWSPKRADRVDVFHELLYFTSVFPHRRLTLRIPLIEIEETRFPYRRRNRRRGQFKVGDQQLLSVVGEDVYRTRGDLRALLPDDLPKTFGTREIAESMNLERWVAQRIAYVLRKTGTVRQCGKSGNSLQYRFAPRTTRKKAVTKKSSSLRPAKRQSGKSTRAA